jgi:hypothetical protein
VRNHARAGFSFARRNVVGLDLVLLHYGRLILWTALAVCVLGALAYDLAYWFDGW